MTKSDSNWLTNYESLKQWTLEHGHFPNRAKVEGRGLLNWYKYNAKLIKQGKLSAIYVNYGIHVKKIMARSSKGLASVT